MGRIDGIRLNHLIISQRTYSSCVVRDMGEVRNQE